MFNPPENIDSLPPKAARNLALTLSDRVSRFNLQNRFSVHKYFTNVHKYHKTWQKSGAAWAVKQRPSCFSPDSPNTFLWRFTVQLSFAAGAARNFYLYLNPAVKSGTTEVLAGNLCDTWQGPEYFIRPTLCHTETQIFHIWAATPGADLNI